MRLRLLTPNDSEDRRTVKIVNGVMTRVGGVFEIRRQVGRAEWTTPLLKTVGRKRWKQRARMRRRSSKWRENGVFAMLVGTT